MKVFLLLCLSSFSFLFMNAQKVQTLPGEKEWVIKGSSSELKQWYFGSGNVFNKDILYFNNEVVFPVRYDNIDKGSGLVKMNKEGKIAWTLNFTSPMIGIAKQKEQVFVFLWTDAGIGFTAVNASTGKKNKEEIVYSPEKKEGDHEMVVSDASGNFKYFVIRVDATHGERFPETADKNAIAKLIMVTADDQMRIAKKELKLAGNGNAFIGVVANDDGELFVGSQNEGVLLIEQFSPQGDPLNKLTASFSLKKKGRYLPVMTIDRQNQKAVLLGMHYESSNKSNKNICYAFDFATKKTLASNEEELDKDFARSLHAVKEHKGIAGRIGSIEDLQIIDILQTPDKIIVIKEMRSQGAPTSPVTDYFYEYLVVSFYDRSWKLLQHIAYDKMLQTSTSGCSLGYWMEKDKVYIVANALTSVLTEYGSLLLTIDANNIQLEKAVVLDKKGLQNRSFIEAGGTIHFGNILYLQNMLPQKAHYNTAAMHTALQKVEL